MTEYSPSAADIDARCSQIDADARQGGYILNPELEFTKALVAGLLVNQNRYGYEACPCRLASGNKVEDLDIICPCDYRDQDIAEFGACYCGLYVNAEIAKGTRKLKPIPERRTPDKNRMSGSLPESLSLKYPIWRCSVCGYLCARETPPEVCPICKVSKERFELFIRS